MLVVFTERAVAIALGEVALENTGQPGTLERARTVRDYGVMVRVT